MNRVGFRSVPAALDAPTSGGRCVLHVFAALVELIGELIVEGTREGVDADRARGSGSVGPRSRAILVRPMRTQELSA